MNLVVIHHYLAWQVMNDANSYTIISLMLLLIPSNRVGWRSIKPLLLSYLLFSLMKGTGNYIRYLFGRMVMPNSDALLEPNLTKSNTNKVPTLIRILVLVPELLCMCLAYCCPILYLYLVLTEINKESYQESLILGSSIECLPKYSR